MKGRLKLAVAVAAVAGLVVVATAAIAGGGSDISERLTGYEEDPATISTTGRGTFDARISQSEERIFYRLRYADLEGDITQAHIHFGGRHQSGGISAFLCTNVGGPAGTQACPPAPATVTGTIEADDVIGPTAQGIEPGAFDELLAAIRAGVTYANVHSTLYPGGEIRAQLDRDRNGEDDKR